MNDGKHSLLAFFAILIAICYLASIAAFLAYRQRYAEALGFGGLTTGLVGVLGTFRPKQSGTDPQTAETLQTAVDKIPPVTPSEAP